MNKKLLEEKQLETDQILLYAPISLDYITEKMINNTLQKLPEIYNFFNINNYRKFQINLFDNLEKFRDFVLSMRDDKKSLPDYATGTYDLGMINAYIHPNIVINSPLYIKKTYTPSHEIVHILYKEIILKNNYNNRIVWLDEGLAQYLSGEKDYLDNQEKFELFLKKIIDNTKEYPDINNIKHGQSFVNDSYNGYDLAYLCVKYLFDSRNLEEIRNIVFSPNKSIEIGKTILKESLDYYINNCKFTYK